ncbi:MAG: ACP S-malonyltransferase [Deltaproteobacteria bacterium]|nr:ACP S-malonyltransferase [Deltaproteobacteria bacterium]
MGRDVFDASPAARAVFEAADRALGFSISKLCFEGPEDELRRTEIQQPAIVTTSIALLRAVEEKLPLAPRFVAGHSLGEYSALVAAGALSLEDAVVLVNKRGRFMQEAVPAGKGAMAALMGLEPASVDEACRTAAAETGLVVSPANYNSSQQIVIAGDASAVERAIAVAKERGAKRAVPLPVSAPFHCALMRPAAERLAGELARVKFADPRVPVITNVEAAPNASGSRIPALLEQQVTAPVRFIESVKQLAALGVTRVIEIGPGSVLTGLVARIERGIERANVSSLEEVNAVVASGAAA